MMEIQSKNNPLYLDVYNDILNKIDTSVYKPGMVLPSEQDLQKQYNVSRITVRRALSDLVHDGLLERTRGRGTVILPKKNKEDLYELSGFTEDAKRNGDIPTSVIIKLDEIKCPSDIAKFLQIDEHEKVYYLKRLRLINGRISGIFETYISQRFSFKISANDFNEKTSLYDFYKENGVIIADAVETLESIMATPELKREMFIESDMPIFYRARITYDNNSKPIEYSKNYYKANGYKYVVHLHRKNAAVSK